MAMDKDDFYRHTSTVIGRQLRPLEVSLLDGLLTCRHKAFYEQSLECGMLDSLRGLIPEFTPLADVAGRVAQGDIGLWLYDRGTQVWITGLKPGVHESLTTVLHAVYADDESMLTCQDGPELYIRKRLGFFVSGALNMRVPIKADNYELSADEEIFNQVKGRLAWRGLR